MKAFLIAGLGNPGKAYEKTRHNIGFRAVEEIASRAKLVFRKKLLLRARVAHGPVANQNVFLMKPESYMNLSGPAVLAAMKKYAVDLERLLVIVDDVDLPFGQMRLRIDSGFGGHNGLKSIEEALVTKRYARLRIGVGDREEGDLASYVLGNFRPDEEKIVPVILERAAEVAECWLTEGITSAMNRIHQKGSSQP